MTLLKERTCGESEVLILTVNFIHHALVFEGVLSGEAFCFVVFGETLILRFL